MVNEDWNGFCDEFAKRAKEVPLKTKFLVARIKKELAAMADPLLRPLLQNLSARVAYRRMLDERSRKGL